MKQQIVLIGLVFAMLTATNAQNNNSATTATAAPVDTTAKAKDYCPHRIWTNFGTAWSNDIYKRLDKVDQKYAIGNVLEVGYSYFFHPNMGVGLGVGISRLSAKALMGNDGSIPVNDKAYIPVGEYDPKTAYSYDLSFDSKDFVEKQGIWAIEVPLTFQFEKRLGDTKRHGIFASLGVRGYFPISAKTKFAGKDVQIWGYDPYLNNTWKVGMPKHFEDIQMGDKSQKSKMRPSVDLAGEFGGLINLTRAADLYLGIYATYGFMDILPKEKVSYVQREGEDAVQGILNSNSLEAYNASPNKDKDISEKWNLLQVGVKVGLRFNTCHQAKQSLRDDKRDLVKEVEELKEAVKALKDDANDPEKKKNKKGNEPVYIIPIYAGGNNPNDKASNAGNGGDLSTDPDAIKLADILSKALIYFPLDKDIPIDSKKANKAVDDAMQILAKRPDIKIVLSGYTCKLGTHDHNVDLGHRRAERIRDMFISRGANSKQITTENFTSQDYPAGMFSTLEEARTVIIKIKNLE